jgi:hypothetical protein
MLSWQDVNLVSLQPKEISSFLQSVKDNLELKILGVYNIPCKCVQVYIDKADSLIDIRVKKHHWHIYLNHPDQSTMTRHFNLEHHLQKISILTMKATLTVSSGRKLRLRKIFHEILKLLIINLNMS